MDSHDSRDLNLLRQNTYDLIIQYHELLCLRAELAKLLFPLKISPPRKCRVRPENRSSAWSSASILLLPVRAPQT